MVRVRAWADPGRPGFTQLTVETVYRPLADPSLPQRELEREVPQDHPVAKKIRAALQGMVKRYGGPPVTRSRRSREAQAGARAARQPDDEAQPPEEP